MYIERMVKPRVLDLLAQFPVVAIVGARQVGKTTLAKEIMLGLDKETIYLDLESPRDANKLLDAEHFLGMHEDKTVILDEVQKQPEVFSVLRSLIDRKRDAGRFIVLGSASPDLLRQSSESLAGRIAYIDLQPFHYDELLTPDFRKHWLYGGYPLVVTAPNDVFRREWLSSFVMTYVERDLAALGLNIESLRLQRLLLMLAGIHGMQLNKSMLARSLQVSVPTISRYLDFLEGSFLIRILPPYATNLRKRVSKTPKLYFTDTGILHEILGIESMDMLFASPSVGHSWEGYVIQQLTAVLGTGRDVYYYQTQSGAEVDLVVMRGTTPVATFEMKFSVAPQIRRGNREAMQTLGAPHNYIVAPIDDAYPAGENTIVTGLAQAIAIAREL